MNIPTKYNSSIGKFLAYLLIFYTFFMLGRSIWINWVLQKDIRRIEEQIVNIQKQNKDLENLILYYKSDSFREVEARRKLGLKKPEEKVENVPVKKYENFSSELESQKEQISVELTQEKVANYRLWWQYFFK